MKVIWHPYDIISVATRVYGESLDFDSYEGFAPRRVTQPVNLIVHLKKRCPTATPRLRSVLFVAASISNGRNARHWRRMRHSKPSLRVFCVIGARKATFFFRVTLLKGRKSPEGPTTRRVKLWPSTTLPLVTAVPTGCVVMVGN